MDNRLFRAVSGSRCAPCLYSSSCSLGSVRASSAASTHSPTSAPVEAMTAAANAPSTNGASTSRTFSATSGSSISRTVSAESTALPMSMKTSTSSASRPSMAERILSGSVPNDPSVSPPTAAISTSPAMVRTSSAVPSATSGLWETSTIPTTSLRPQRPGGGIEQQIRRARTRVHVPSGPLAKVARPAPPGGERNGRLGSLVRCLGGGPEHLADTLAGGGRLPRGLGRRRQGIDHRLVPLLGLATLLDARERRLEGPGHVFR